MIWFRLRAGSPALFFASIYPQKSVKNGLTSKGFELVASNCYNYLSFAYCSLLMKQMYIIILVIVVALTAFFGYKAYRRTYLQANFERSAGSSQNRLGNTQEGPIPQSGDLCGGTGGNGEIVSLDTNAFSLKLKNGTNRLIHLANQTTIKTSAGSSATESDLKTGDRVTLVGGPNPDGSFTANGIFVCSGN